MGGLKANTETKQPRSPSAVNHQPRGERQERNTEMKDKIINVCLGVALTAAMFALPPIVVIVGIIALPLVFIGR